MKLLAAAASALLVCGAAALPRSGRPQTPTDVLADAKKAFDYAAKNITTSYECGWTRGTYMIGLWDYYNATKSASHALLLRGQHGTRPLTVQRLERRDPAAKAYLEAWGKSYDYKLCAKGAEYSDMESTGARRRMQGACVGDKPLGCKGVHNANNQLCGATYVEMAMAGLVPLETATADTVKIFGAEIAAAPSSNNFWSWVDAAFMAMNTWARMGAATGEAKYFEKQWSNFNAAMLLPAEGHGSNDEGKTFVSLSGAALCCRPEARR